MKLECSSKGDKRFSAFYAFVEFNGKYDSIEHHYQNCKRNSKHQPCQKGEYVSYIVVCGQKLPASDLTPFSSKSIACRLCFSIQYFYGYVSWEKR